MEKVIIYSVTNRALGIAIISAQTEAGADLYKKTVKLAHEEETILTLQEKYKGREIEIRRPTRP